jgi:phage-related protein
LPGHLISGISSEHDVPRRPVFWIGSSLRDLKAMPEEVQDVIGRELLDLQYFDTPPSARRFGEGLPREVMKLVAADDRRTFRVAYVAAFREAVYVLDAFVKKSMKGIGTPQQDRVRVLRRYAAARAHHATHFGQERP